MSDFKIGGTTPTPAPQRPSGPISKTAMPPSVTAASQHAPSSKEEFESKRKSVTGGEKSLRDIVGKVNPREDVEDLLDSSGTKPLKLSVTQTKKLKDSIVITLERGQGRVTIAEESDEYDIINLETPHSECLKKIEAGLGQTKPDEIKKSLDAADNLWSDHHVAYPQNRAEYDELKAGISKLRSHYDEQVISQGCETVKSGLAQTDPKKIEKSLKEAISLRDKTSDAIKKGKVLSEKASEAYKKLNEGISKLESHQAGQAIFIGAKIVAYGLEQTDLKNIEKSLREAISLRDTAKANADKDPSLLEEYTELKKGLSKLKSHYDEQVISQGNDLVKKGLAQTDPKDIEKSLKEAISLRDSPRIFGDIRSSLSEKYEKLKEGISKLESHLKVQLFLTGYLKPETYIAHDDNIAEVEELLEKYQTEAPKTPEDKKKFEVLNAAYKKFVDANLTIYVKEILGPLEDSHSILMNAVSKLNNPNPQFQISAQRLELIRVVKATLSDMRENVKLLNEIPEGNCKLLDKKRKWIDSLEDDMSSVSDKFFPMPGVF